MTTHKAKRKTPKRRRKTVVDKLPLRTDTNARQWLRDVAKKAAVTIRRVKQTMAVVEQFGERTYTNLTGEQRKGDPKKGAFHETRVVKGTGIVGIYSEYSGSASESMIKIDHRLTMDHLIEALDAKSPHRAIAETLHLIEQGEVITPTRLRLLVQQKEVGHRGVTAREATQRFDKQIAKWLKAKEYQAAHDRRYPRDRPDVEP